jgi:hypothetical protein
MSNCKYFLIMKYPHGKPVLILMTITTLLEHNATEPHLLCFSDIKYLVFIRIIKRHIILLFMFHIKEPLMVSVVGLGGYNVVSEDTQGTELM